MGLYMRALLAFILLVANFHVFPSEYIVSTLSGKSVALAVPHEMTEIRKTDKLLSELAQTTTPPDAKLLGFFVTDKFLSDKAGDNLRRRASLFTPKLMESINFSKDDIAALIDDYKRQLASQRESNIIRNFKGATLNLDKNHKALAERYSLRGLKVGITTPMIFELFSETPESISMIVVSSYRFGDHNKITGEFFATTLLVKSGKLFNLNVYGDPAQEEDISWAKSVSEKWIIDTLSSR